jgi:anhydro-N-acetylmuramic acid kinase
MKPSQPKPESSTGAFRPLRWKPLIVAGVMSGTSADGVDVAICRISPALRADTAPCIKLLGHRSFPYDKKLRAKVLSIAAGETTTAAELSQLSWRLGELYAECIETTASELSLKPQLAAMHGQTVYHQAAPAKFLGVPLRCTSQIGEPALLAERLRIPVVSDFRPADLAAGGQGAPLVPMLDFCSFRHLTKNRLLLNLGGIANVTALPAACTSADVLAFDTGPASILIDLLMQRLYSRSFDKNGAVAATGQVLKPVLDDLLATPFFSAPTPKSCGREEFGPAFAHKLLALCKEAPKQDVIATATALTATTILDAYRRFCWPHLGQHAPLATATELIAAGGGTKNHTLMRLLTEGLDPLGIKVSTTASTGLPVEAKEAAAFALLGWLTWHGLPGNIRSATGACRAVILGKVAYP